MLSLDSSIAIKTIWISKCCLEVASLRCKKRDRYRLKSQVQVVPDLLVCSLAVVLVQGLQKSCSSAGRGQAVVVGHHDPLSDQEDQQELEELHHSLLESAA